MKEVKALNVSHQYSFTNFRKFSEDVDIWKIYEHQVSGLLKKVMYFLFFFIFYSREEEEGKVHMTTSERRSGERF